MSKENKKTDFSLKELKEKIDEFFGNLNKVLDEGEKLKEDTRELVEKIKTKKTLEKIINQPE